MYKRVLIPVDGSEMAEGVLPLIEQIAGPLALEVILLSVVEPTPVVDELARRRDAARVYLADLATELRAKGIRVEKTDRCGDPVEQILDTARADGADLIAMTTHGRTGPARLLFGSVAEGVLRQADVPVVLMRQPVTRD